MAATRRLLNAPWLGPALGLVMAATLMLAGAMLLSASAWAKTRKAEALAELLLTGLPERTSKDYAELLRLAGADARITAADTAASETWVLPRSRLKRLTRRLHALGVKSTTLDVDWNRLLKPPDPRLKLTDGQELVLEALKSSDHALVVGVMAALKGAAAEESLRPDPRGGLTVSRPGARVVIPFNDKERITAVRKAVEKRRAGWTWRGEVEDTGEPVMLMWWQNGKFTGIFSYRGRIYTLRAIGGDLYAIIETEPDKLPPDHGPSPAQSGQTTALKDDPLVARGEAAALRAGKEPADRPNSKDLANAIKTMFTPPTDAPAGVSSTSLAPLSAAKRRRLASQKVTIDVMLLYTPKVAKHYLDIDTDLIALAVEQANQSFVTSGIENVKLRLVHHQQIKYEEAKRQHFEHLYSMVDAQGPFAGTATLRDQKRADVVALIVDDASGCGLSTRVAAGADEAFVVVHHTCAALTYSIAHEIGHIIGARHDKALDPNTTPFPYGHGYVNGTKWRDIMSYRQSCSGCPRIPYWSNPTIKIRGEPGGAADADNARVILEQAERVANFR
jgi:hypothetical protein